MACCFGAPAEEANLSEAVESEALKNRAFVFIKPHAANDEVTKYVKEQMNGIGLKVLSEGTIGAQDIDKKGLIDNHYYAIASKAVILTPDKLNVPKDKFQEQFGIGWDDALEKGIVYNAVDACKKLDLTAEGLEKEWRKTKGTKDVIKFGGGFYCAKIQDIYVFNGFFLSLREKFVAEGKKIIYFDVEWDAQTLPWGEFRESWLGVTDPSKAKKGSIRATLFEDWETKFKLPAEPNTGDNGVHGSASAFEGLAERMNWLQDTYDAATDEFAMALSKMGLEGDLLAKWSKDPVVKLEDGTMGSLFDALEELDAAACVAKLETLLKLNKQSAAEEKSG